MKLFIRFSSLFLVLSVFVSATPRQNPLSQTTYTKATPPFAYVVNPGSHNITPINMTTNTASTSISLAGTEPFWLAITPDGTTAYMPDGTNNQIIPINLLTNTPEAPITGFTAPSTMIITPDGTKAYVAESSNNVKVLDLATKTITASIPISNLAQAIAITPDGKTVYVGTTAGTVIPITIATNTAGSPISLFAVPPSSSQPSNAAILPNGTKLYVVDAQGFVTIIDIQTNTRITTFDFGSAGPTCVSVTPDGSTAYITLIANGTIVPIDATTNALGTPISIGAQNQPYGIAISPDSTTAYVVSVNTNSVIPVTLASGALLTPIPVGQNPLIIALAPIFSPQEPNAPHKFRGKISHRTKRHRAHATLKTRWLPSTSSDIASYQIFAYKKQIASITAKQHMMHRKIRIYSGYLRKTHIPKKYLRILNKKYQVRAVTTDGTPSSFVPIHTSVSK